MDWLRTERAGLESAVLHAAQAGLDELCWDLAITSVTLFESENQVEDWRRTHELALDAVRRVENRRGEAALLYSLATLDMGMQPAEADRHLRYALEIFAKLGDVIGRALTLSALASIERLGGHPRAALQRYESALAGFRQVGDKVCQADALSNMANIKMDCRDFVEAGRMLAEAKLICRSIGSPRAAAQTEFRQGELHLHTGEFAQAERSFKAVQRAATDRGDLVGEAYALAGLVAASTEQAQYAEAEASLAAALSLSTRIDHNLVRGRIILSAAELYIAKGEGSRALSVLSEALVLFTELGSESVWQFHFLEVKSRAYRLVGRTAAAAAARLQAIDLAGGFDPALAHSLILASERVDSRWWR